MPTTNQHFSQRPAPGSEDEKPRDAVYGMPVSTISHVLWASGVLRTPPQTHQPVLGDGQGAGAHTKSKLLLLVRYCYEVEEQAGERAEDERRRADTCVAAALAVRVLDL